MGSLGRQSTIGFIGAGMVGSSLAVVLSRAGYSTVAAASRTFASAQALAARVPGCAAVPAAQAVADRADVVFITTPDDAIATVADSLSWRPGQGVVHCSGAASLDVLEGAVRQGALAGAYHPIQPFSSVENGVSNIPGTTFGIEGQPEMRSFLEDVAKSTGGVPIFLRSEDKPLYHLTAVMMGNLLTVLAGVAAGLWENFGMTRADGLKALVPMMRHGADNLETSGLPAALAGPYPRGDIGTVRKHLEALETQAPHVLPLYRELALAAIPLAVEKGTLQVERADEIRELIARSGQGTD